MKILVTGGAGFIGSAFVRMALAGTGDAVTNLDKLTYAGNLENLQAVEGHPRYRFVEGDICDERLVNSLVAEETPDALVHFAAESHVDRSILSPAPVIDTNLRGTFVLLEAARLARTRKFVHISTDEVYGSLEPPLEATEEFLLNPSSLTPPPRPVPICWRGRISSPTNRCRCMATACKCATGSTWTIIVAVHDTNTK
jgi:dTDP-glucose 4,6-dehydratase